MKMAFPDVQNYREKMMCLTEDSIVLHYPENIFIFESEPMQTNNSLKNELITM